MSGRKSRDKGKRGEREARDRIRRYGYNAQRGVQYKGGPDSPDVTGLPGVHLEVKRVQALQLYVALSQSDSDAAEDEFPVVMHRKDRQDWVIIQPFDDWMLLYEGAKELQRQSGEKAEQSLRGFLKGLLEKLLRDRMV